MATSEVMEVLGRIQESANCIKEDVASLKNDLSALVERHYAHDRRILSLELKESATSSRFRFILDNLCQLLNALVLAFLLFKLGISR